MIAALIITSGHTNSKTKLKPEKIIGTITAVERVAILLQQTGIDRIVVVCDKNSKLQKFHSSVNFTFLYSPSEGEMLDSIKIGLEYLQDKCTGVLIAYVDVPMFSMHTAEALITAEGDICIPSYQGRWGHPIFLQAKHFSKILAYHGERGLRGAIDAAGLQKQIIPVDDAGILADIQKDGSYKKLLSGHDAARLRLSYRFEIGKERIFYGPDIHQLLQLIDELGSLSKACTYMGISLNKGRTIISTIEQQLKQPVLETQQGGKNGGYSHLTNDIKQLMNCYDDFCSEANNTLQQIFQKYFPSDTEL